MKLQHDVQSVSACQRCTAVIRNLRDDDVLCLPRKPYILTHIRDEPSEAGATGEAGEEAAVLNEAIMKVLMENGRLQMEQVIHAAMNKLQLTAEDARDMVQRHFLGLVQVGCFLHT